jgi:hypothetical protein
MNFVFISVNLRNLRIVLLGLLYAIVVNAEIVDRILVTVGRQVITLSDVRRQDHLESFIAGREPTELDASKTGELVERLIDQALLQKEMTEGAFPAAEPEMVEPAFREVRNRFKDEASWRAALERYDLKETDVRKQVQFQADIVSFVDFRIRSAIEATPQGVEQYYREKFLPELRRRGAAELPLNDVREQIGKLLQEEEVNQNLASLLKELRTRTEIHRR